jgi:hypothetical protein
LQYTAQNASSFIATLGVNTHLSWTGTQYTNASTVASELKYLGLNNVRDTIDNSTSYGVINTLMSQGVHFDLWTDKSDMSGFLSQAHNLQVAHPGGVIAIEGPNEVDGWPVSWNGQTGYAGSDAYQKALFNSVKADPVLANTPVYLMTVSGMTPSKYQAVGDMHASANYGNVHIYWGGGQPGYGWSPNDPTFYWSNYLKSAAIDAPGLPVVVTEAGATTAIGSTTITAVDQTTQAKQLLNMFMDAAKNGVAQTFIYELADSHNAGPSDAESHFGLYNWDGTPKLAATAIHNFTTILTDGSTSSNFATGTLDYSIQGVPQWGGQMLYQEGNGAKDIVVWAEPDIWNESTNTPITAPNTPITIDLATAANVTIYDPMKGTTPVQSLGVTSHITFNVTDHPLIVEVKAVGATSPPTGGVPNPTTGPSDQWVTNVLRTDPSSSLYAGLQSQLNAQLNAGTITQDAAVHQVVQAASATTSVATLAYEFFTNAAPNSAGLDYLVSPSGPNPNNLNSAYYQDLNLENRYINFAVNLGKDGQGASAFSAGYGNESLFDATRQAYAKIFGAAPSDAKLHAILDPTVVVNGVTATRADYFAYYGGDGSSGAGTKAAMVGWLLAEAVKADVGVYAHANDALLTDVALHNAALGVDLVGLYAKPADVFIPG